MKTNPMNVQRMVPGLIEKVNPAKAQAAEGGKSSETGFAQHLSNMINQVNELQSDSSRMQEALMNGEPVELHQVMIKAEEAGLAMDLLLEVRNKLIDAYNDLARMPM